MTSNTKSEIWVQALYGKSWEDFQESIDIADAKDTTNILKNKRPNGRFRIVQKLFVEKVLEEN